MEEITKAQTEVPKKGVSIKVKLALIVLGAVVPVYTLQFLLTFIFRWAAGTDDVTRALLPYANHYLSFSPWFVANEGMSSEFTGDLTGAGRFFCWLPVPILIFMGTSAVLYLIKPLRRFFGKVWAGLFLGMILAVFIQALFLPPKMTVFKPAQKQMVVYIHKSLWSHHKTILDTGTVGKIRSRFFGDYSGYTMQTLVYSQLYVLWDDQPYVLGENEVASFSGKNKPWAATAAQKEQADKAVTALNKLMGFDSSNDSTQTLSPQ
jgi:hypothetical protein